MISAALRLAAFLLLTAAAVAAPPPGTDVSSPLHAWFEAQHSVTGAWCCNLSDGHLLDEDDWGHDALGYRVRIGGAWVDVPQSAMRDPKGGPNPTGHAIVWYTQGSWGLHVYCFSPGWEG